MKKINSESTGLNALAKWLRSLPEDDRAALLNPTNKIPFQSPSLSKITCTLAGHFLNVPKENPTSDFEKSNSQAQADPSEDFLLENTMTP